MNVTEVNYDDIQKFADKIYCNTKITAIRNYDNMKFQVEGTHMWTPELINFITEYLDCHLERVCYIQKSHSWIGIFSRKKRGIQE